MPKLLVDLLAPILTDLLSGFIKPGSLSSDTLRIGIWSGNLTLTDVELNPDVLNALGLPIVLRYGR
jgi:hypothetical protein